jgi:hypothetical protein
MLGPSGADAGPGETIAGIERDAEIGSVKSGGCAVDHFIAAYERESGRTGMGGVGGADNKFVEHQIESEIGRKSGLDVLLKDVREIRQAQWMRIVADRFGPDRVRKHAPFQQPAECIVSKQALRRVSPETE